MGYVAAVNPELSAKPIWVTWTCGEPLPAGIFTEPSPLVGTEQVKLEIVPATLEQGTPSMLTVISAVVNPINDGSVIEMVYVDPDKAAEVTTGVAAKLNWYEQSSHTAGKELTANRKAGVDDAV